MCGFHDSSIRNPVRGSVRAKITSLQSCLITEPLCSETSLDIHGALVTWISSLFLFFFFPRGKQVQDNCNSESCSYFIKVLEKTLIGIFHHCNRKRTETWKFEVVV